MKPVRTAAQAGVVECPQCTAIFPRSRAGSACTRCGAALNLRKPDSLRRTWAFLLAAMVLYLPANLLPIMTTGTLFGTQSNTIMSGVVYLWHDQSYFVAAVVFCASIVIPIFKLAVLLMLVVTTQARSTWRPLERTRLYGMVEAVGRWSMVDVFVVALLASLVHLDALATVRPEPGAIAFGAVVVLTMLASMSFDPRLIWDPVDVHDTKA
ncbi:paraquat-inducible membrane protein A [Pigmentiphaga sp. NML080357]|uniref:paraquat-inducible protein A n=1 Tax=Pigmentiphaga sp. NML080357 TaxID=2008675 RepID=UPI000B41537C|nr:paraquat-inducible protein A [Pigmentiphaga sp. NML080357]OVZ57265.1 paraquat-inducible membrane protein A [Pigmentiphaga sp. NML080357]